VTATNIQDLERLAQTELSSLINYFHANNLVPNPTKTNYTLFFPRPAPPIKLTINENRLKQNNKAKLLGIIIQNDLKHHQTIINIIRKLQPTIYSFKYANKFLATKTMTKLYYSLVYPHLIGAIAIWGTTNPNTAYIKPLIRTHKRILRLLKNLPHRTHTKPIMKELNILSLVNLYTLRVCAEMHPFIYPKTQKNRPLHNHSYLWTAQIHEYYTRQSKTTQQYIPNPNNYSKTKKSTHTMEHLTEKHSNIWNAIPENIREITSLYVFKKKLKHYLLERQKPK
jgi:hypothetical protein